MDLVILAVCKYIFLTALFILRFLLFTWLQISRQANQWGTISLKQSNYPITVECLIELDTRDVAFKI